MSQKADLSATLAGLKRINACVLIPTYNNDQTLNEVLKDFQGFENHLILVNDGSSDRTSEIIKKYKDFEIISYHQNQGKGHALKLGMQRASDLNFRYAISMDSDGQHSSSDIVHFIDYIEEHPNTLIVGSRNLEAENMPGKNTFGNKFSNFWYQIETGIKLSDTQSGFRLYPVEEVLELKLMTGKYEFELEVLVKAAWKSIPIASIPISVYYPPEGERVSHFKPFRDFTRISILNTFLVLSGLLIYRPLIAFKRFRETDFRSWFKTNIVKPEEGIEKKAMAIGFGFFMGIFPVWGYQMLIAVFLAHYFKLNKAIVLLASNISIAPLMPFVLYFSFVFGGQFVENPVHLTMDLEEISLDVIGKQLWQYVIGSIALALLAGIIGGLLSYLLLLTYKRLNSSKT